MHEARVVEGHGVASGRANDDRFPQGTLALQWPHFKEEGIPLEGMFLGTLNLDFGSALPEFPGSDHTVRQLKWHPDCPPEDFSFTRVELWFARRVYPAWLYLPHPETKPEHFQPVSVREFIAPKIPDLGYGNVVHVHFP